MKTKPQPTLAAAALMLGTTPESIKMMLPLMQQADKVMLTQDRSERGKLVLNLSDAAVGFATSLLFEKRFHEFNSNTN